MRIANNIPALSTYTNMLKTSRSMEQAMMRMSTSIRINSVKDDAAGLAIANSLKLQISGTEIASRNALDGISMIQTADGSLNEVQGMLQRIRELSVQAVNGTNDPGDRRKLDEEVQQLKSEISTTAEKCEFNRIGLLSGGAARQTNPMGDTLGVVNCSYTSDSVNSFFSETNPASSTEGKVTFDIVSVGMPAVMDTGNSSMTANPNLNGKLYINGEEIEILPEDTKDDVIDKFRELLERNDIEGMVKNGNWDEYVNGTKPLMLYTLDQGSNQKIVVDGNPAILAALGLTKTQAAGTDAELANIKYNGESLTPVYSGNEIRLTGTMSKSFDLNIDLKGPNTIGHFYTRPSAGAANIATIPSGALAAPMNGNEIRVMDFGLLKLQVGADYSMEVHLQLPDVKAESLGIEWTDVKTFQSAQDAIAEIDFALDRVSEIRSKIGAYQNRLEHTISTLDSSSENSARSLSRIYDTDMVLEMSNMTKYNVMYQAGISIMAQANQRPQQVLQLIGK